MQNVVNIANGDMGQDEVLGRIQSINDSAENIYHQLIAIKSRNGYLALGFESWGKFLSSPHLKKSRSWLYEILASYPVQDKHKSYGLNTKQAGALAKFPEHMQESILIKTKAHFDELTANRIEVVGDALQMAIETGATGDGLATKDNIDGYIDEAIGYAATPNIYIDTDYEVDKMGRIILTDLPPGVIVSVRVTHVFQRKDNDNGC